MVNFCQTLRKHQSLKCSPETKARCASEVIHEASIAGTPRPDGHRRARTPAGPDAEASPEGPRGSASWTEGRAGLRLPGVQDGTGDASGQRRGAGEDQETPSATRARPTRRGTRSRDRSKPAAAAGGRARGRDPVGPRRPAQAAPARAPRLPGPGVPAGAALCSGKEGTEGSPGRARSRGTLGLRSPRAPDQLVPFLEGPGTDRALRPLQRTAETPDPASAQDAGSGCPPGSPPDPPRAAPVAVRPRFLRDSSRAAAIGGARGRGPPETLRRREPLRAERGLYRQPHRQSRPAAVGTVSTRSTRPGGQPRAGTFTVAALVKTSSLGGAGRQVAPCSLREGLSSP